MNAVLRAAALTAVLWLTAATTPSAQAQALEDPFVGRSFAELLARDDFGSAYRAAVQRTPVGRAAWPMKDAGLPPSSVVTLSNSSQFVRTATCGRPRCDANSAQVFYSRADGRIFVYLTVGGRGGWTGAPDTFVRQELLKHLQQLR
jgi:hypothetical protein